MVGSIQNELNDFLYKPMGNHISANECDPERIIFVSRGITVLYFLHKAKQLCALSFLKPHLLVYGSYGFRSNSELIMLAQWRVSFVG